MKSKKNLKALMAQLRDIKSRGGLELKQMETLEALIRRVDHAVTINDRKGMQKAWNELARELCVVFMRHGA